MVYFKHTCTLIKMKKRPTIKDIAKIAGVTHSTVSRVITNNHAIGKETRVKVLQIIKKLNYQPNLIARGLVRKKTRALALIAPPLDPHVLPIIKGIEESCKEYNYALMIKSTDYWADEGASYFQIAENWLVDGILILNNVYYNYKRIPANVKRLQRERIPFVFINKYLGSKKVNTVSVDNYDGVYQTIEHLVSLGRRRIGAMMSGDLMPVDGVERFEGYKEALKKFNLEYDEDIVRYSNWDYNEAYEEMKSILYGAAKQPDAMFCANDRMAMGVIKAIEEKGLKVPEDIAVVGFDDIEAGRYIKPSLTTIRSPLEDIGNRAINLMMEVIEDSEKPIQEISLKAKLIIRESSNG